MPGQLRAESVRRATRTEEPKSCAVLRKASPRYAVRKPHNETPGAPLGLSRMPPSMSARIRLEIAPRFRRKLRPQGPHEKPCKANLPEGRSPPRPRLPPPLHNHPPDPHRCTPDHPPPA